MISPTFLLIFVFISTLTLAIWLLNKVPQHYLTAFDAVQRHSPLDGIRGILAICVFTHHFYKNYFFQITQRWQSPPIDFFTNLGSVSVSIFFLITGYLFFGKIRAPSIDWWYLYRSRVQRIMPLYLLLGVGIVIIYCTQQHPALSITAWQNWLLRWLSFNNQSLKDFFAWPLVAGAAWTLLYEWSFYFCLPLLHVCLHPKRILHKQDLLVLIISLPLLYYGLIHTSPRLYWLFFLAFFAVWLADVVKNLRQRFPRLLTVVVLLLASFIMLETQAYSTLQIGLCAVLFCFIANGFDGMGLLYQKGLKILGDLSYSLYLTHGLVMYVCFNMLKIMDFTKPMSHYIFSYPLIFFLIILVAYICYRYIEKPLMYRPKYLKNCSTALHT